MIRHLAETVLRTLVSYPFSYYECSPDFGPHCAHFRPNSYSSVCLPSMQQNCCELRASVHHSVIIDQSSPETSLTSWAVSRLSFNSNARYRYSELYEVSSAYLAFSGHLQT